MSDTTMSQTIGELAKALAKAQSQITGATKDSENPFFKSKYADLGAVWDAIRKPLTSNGIAVLQTTAAGPDGSVRIITSMVHESGEWMRGELEIKPTKPDPQSLGSAITYGRRYALQAIAGVAPEDDDGNAASAEAPKPREQQLPPQTTTKPAKRPYELVTAIGELLTFERGSEYLQTLSDEFAACGTSDEKVGFWETNKDHFQEWQIKAVQASEKDPRKKPTSDAFCKVGGEIAGAIHLIYQTQDKTS